MEIIPRASGGLVRVVVDGDDPQGTGRWLDEIAEAEQGGMELRWTMQT